MQKVSKTKQKKRKRVSPRKKNEPTVTLLLPESITREIASYNYQQPTIDKQEKEIKELKKKLAEAEEAVPALFAAVGDSFTHRVDQDFLAYGDPVVEYEGRTDEGWLIFHHVDGEDLNRTYGGMRDAIGAWPIEDYRINLPNGEIDLDRIKLPINMVYMFRKEIFYDDEYIDVIDDEEIILQMKKDRRIQKEIYRQNGIAYRAAHGDDE